MEKSFRVYLCLLVILTVPVKKTNAATQTPPIIEQTPPIIAPSPPIISHVYRTFSEDGGIAGSVQRHACFNNVLDIQCEASEIIVFDSARYGRNNTEIASRCSTPFQRNCDIDAHFTLNRLCAGQPKCALVVNTQLFGDPCGYEEFLTVSYKCVPVSSMHRTCQPPGSPPFFDHGYIASPNYPSKYYSDAECTWHLAVQPRQTIKVTIYDFELDVKREGKCYDYIEIETRGQSAFKDCGALGKQSIGVDSNSALIRFKTGQSSLTQRGFFIHFAAVGPGCPDLTIPMNGTVVYRMFNGELTANVTCLPGFVFAGTDHSTMMLRCKGSEWNLSVSSCVEFVPTTTSLGTTSLIPTGSNVLTSEANDLVKSSSIIGIALGIVSALLLITLLLVLSLYLHRRFRANEHYSSNVDLTFAQFLMPSGLTLCHERQTSRPNITQLEVEDGEDLMRKKAERKLDQMRVVFNNLQENAMNDETIQQVMDASLNIDTPSNLRKGKRGKKNKNYKEDDLQGRNLLSPPCYVDDDDYDSPKDIMSETYMKYPMIIDDTYKSFCSAARRASRTGKYSLSRSRDSYLDGADSPYEWDEYDITRTRSPTHCNANGGVGAGRPRPSRTRSGVWDNKSVAIAMTPRVAPTVVHQGGRLIDQSRKTFTQSAPDILELLMATGSGGGSGDDDVFRHHQHHGHHLPAHHTIYTTPQQAGAQLPPGVCPVHPNAGPPPDVAMHPGGPELAYFSPDRVAPRSSMTRSSTLGAVHSSHRTLHPKSRSGSRGRIARC